MTERKIFISQPATGQEEWEALKDPVFSGWLTQGPKVAQFENEFAEKYGSDYALATTSCTTAMHLILVALGVGPGDEVIVPAFTWVATANVVRYCGAKPVFVDVEPHTYNLDPSKLQAKLTENTRAIFAVHLFGLCADMAAIKEIADSIPVIEDAACAVGSQYHGQYAGSLGAAAAFSFHPRKTLTTGEGGMITTDDEALAERCNKLRNHGASISEEQRHHGPQPYLLPEFNVLGFNYRMTDLQGAVGLAQMKKIDQLQAERKVWANNYLDALADIPWLNLPYVPEGCEHAWQAFVCRVDESQSTKSRNEIMELLQQKGISTRPGTHAVHMLGLYKNELGLNANDFPQARDCDRYTMALPLHNRMTEADYDYIIDALRQIS